MSEYSALHDALLSWFASNKEHLPWRGTHDPYAVWVSEVMLQQTQVKTVIPYFERFLARFPDVTLLASASLDEALKLWEGLGYYSRVRNLHRAARQIVTEYGGVLPVSAADLAKLPGIGRYTAGAIASIAYRQDAPVLDGNVIRVLARAFRIREDITQSKTLELLWNLAEQLIPPGRAGDWNEALMELGRRVCTPRTPACDECPLRDQCEGYRHGEMDTLPIRTRRPSIPCYDVTAGVITRQDGHLLIAQRPADGLLGGLWEFPGGKREEGESLPDCLIREVREELGIDIEVGPQIAVVKHAYTHFKIILFAFICRYLGGIPQAMGCADWAWVNLDDLGEYAFPATDRKIIAVMRDRKLGGAAV